MSEKSILQGNCEVCGPSQSGPEPLLAPGQVGTTTSHGLLIERPVTKRQEEYDCGATATPLNAETFIKAKDLIESGPFIVIGAGPHIVFGGMDARIGIHLLLDAIIQQFEARIQNR